jgi:hypothetical protein
MLREAFVGPPGPWTYFTDNRPGVGLLSTLKEVSPADASESNHPDGSTIAGHAQHLVVKLSQATGELAPKAAASTATQSWTVSSVTPDEWRKIQKDLNDEYNRLLRVVQEIREWDEESSGTAIGAVAHVAYHLGAIRQRLVVSGKLKS